MRQDAVTLERFYASPLGSAAARILSTKVIDLWGDANNLSLLGLGYALPVLDAFGVHPGRSVAAVPFDHGPVRWDPTGRGNATVSVGDLRLPFPDGMFDRVIVLHGLLVPSHGQFKRALHATAIDRDRDRSGGGMGCHRAPDYPRPWRRRHGRSGEAALCVTRWRRGGTGRGPGAPGQASEKQWPRKALTRAVLPIRSQVHKTQRPDDHETRDCNL